MHDRGDKIVTLAREILRTDGAHHLSEETKSRITFSFKMLCMVTVLTAVSSSALTGWVVETRRPLNHYEKTELDALVFYAARQKNLKEDELRQEVLEKLNLPSFDNMTAQDFITARALLQAVAQ